MRKFNLDGLNQSQRVVALLAVVTVAVSLFFLAVPLKGRYNCGAGGAALGRYLTEPPPEYVPERDAESDYQARVEYEVGASIYDRCGEAAKSRAGWVAGGLGLAAVLWFAGGTLFRDQTVRPRSGP